jgi:23S rRNA (adenine2030-N6)-methyltransferase
MHESEAALLRQGFRGDPRVAVHERDGYEMLQALIPPAERRGLALLDPPFEEPGEFDKLANELMSAAGRWPSGIYALWYPLKEEAASRRFLRTLERSGLHKLLVTELRLPTTPGALAGSGLLILNPPWGTEAPMRECLEALARELGPKGSSAEVRWLVSE